MHLLKRKNYTCVSVENCLSSPGPPSKKIPSQMFYNAFFGQQCTKHVNTWITFPAPLIFSVERSPERKGELLAASSVGRSSVGPRPPPLRARRSPPRACWPWRPTTFKSYSTIYAKLLFRSLAYASIQLFCP